MNFHRTELGVVIATCDRHEMLRYRSIPSVLKQTFRPHFLIVVDDSSEPETRQKNEQFVLGLDTGEMDVHYTTNIKTKGACGAWNTGIFHLEQLCKSSDSTYLAILDDDDEWLPSYLQICLEKVEHMALDMVATNIIRIEDTEENSTITVAPISLKASDFLIGNPGIQGSNLFLRLSTMLQAGCFDENLTSSTDRDVCIRICDLGDTEYQRVDSALVKHYAEKARERMSTVGSPSKNTGLDSFFQKYSGRMSNFEVNGFIQRASKLFNWQPDEEVLNRVRPKRVKHHSLVIGFEYNEKTASYFQEIKDEEIIGMTLVIHGNLSNKSFVENVHRLRERGFSCYSIDDELTKQMGDETILHRCCEYISSKRPGSQSCIIETEIGDDIQIDSIQSMYGVIAAKYDEERLDSRIIKHLEKERRKSARVRVEKNFGVTDLYCLGTGSEAVIFTDKRCVYKVIDYWKTRDPKREMSFLESQVGMWSNESNLYCLEKLIHDGPWVIITYQYEHSEPYIGGYEESVIDLIESCRKSLIVCNNIHPKNLIVVNGVVKLVDYGSDIRPWNSTLDEFMIRRAYLTVNYADHPRLSELLRFSLSSINFEEMIGYASFKSKLKDFRPSSNEDLPVQSTSLAPRHPRIIFGVITNEPETALRLLQSIAKYFPSSKVILLDNASPMAELLMMQEAVKVLDISLDLIDVTQQSLDAKNQLFGKLNQERPSTTLGISQSRSMLQHYVGRHMSEHPGSVGWILDDDMEFDDRALNYPKLIQDFSDKDIDVVIGSYDGASPNPPVNGLRTRLVDFVHNWIWLCNMPQESILPSRSFENQILREKSSDYYYDLSRKHTNHLESPIWVEPQYAGETVKDAKMRYLFEMNRLLSGHPTTRPVKPPSSRLPIQLRDTVNRGGITIVFNSMALCSTPNQIFTIRGHEARRSDMVWAIVNKYYRGLSIKAANIPILHHPRHKVVQSINEEKMVAEFIGSSFYAGLSEYMSLHTCHNLEFTDAEASKITNLSLVYLKSRIQAFRQSIHRIHGLLKTSRAYFHSSEVPQFIVDIESQPFQEILASIEELAQDELYLVIKEFLLDIKYSVEDFNTLHHR